MSTKSYFFRTYVKAPANGYDTTSVSVTPPRFRLPAGFRVGSYACVIESFDMAFKSRRDSKLKGQHSIHQFKLVPTPTISSDGELTLDVDFILNKESDTDNNEKNDSYISPDSYVGVLTIVTAVDSASEIQAFSTSCEASVPASDDTTVTFAGSNVVASADVSTALSGWEFIVSSSDSDNQDDQQIACFDITSGASGQTVTADKGTHTAMVTGAYAALNNHDTQSSKDAKKNDPFDSTGTFVALTADASDIAVAEFDAGTGTVTHDFGAPLKNAYAVIRNLKNFGENSASSEDDTNFNELASFTCMGPKLTVSGTTVSFDWNTVLAHWGDKFSGSSLSLDELVAFKTSVDLMVIAQFE